MICGASSAVVVAGQATMAALECFGIGNWANVLASARVALRAFGAVAQLGERRVRNAKVEGSTPFRST